MIRWMLIALLASSAFATDSAKSVFSDSFKKGPTRIAEQTFDVTVTAEQPKQEFKIADVTGKQRYILRFIPEVHAADPRILGWFVRLVDLHHKLYDSVLPTSQDLTRDQGQVWWFDGRSFPKIPLETRRIFRVEQFYCVIQVKEVKRMAPGQSYLNQMSLGVQFTNTKP